MPAIVDPEVQLLAAIAAQLEADYAPPENDPWADSPFAWIKTQPSRRVGKIGEQLVSGWCAAKGFDVVGSPNSDADRIIHGYRVEIKFSTLWANGGYKFQQVRDQQYDHMFCLGVGPFSAHAWFLPKAVLLEYVIGHMGQHTGASGTDTAWLGFDANAPFGWMRPYGGALSDALAVIQSLPRGHG